MNLLSMLLSSMTTQDSVSNISEKTGVSGTLIKKLLPLALPILIQALTRNASNKDGATSLLGALSQHTSTKTVDRQLKTADTEDGAKIVNHILGDRTDTIERDLARSTGMTKSQVGSILSCIAPVLLSGLSAANSQNTQSSSVNPLSLMGLLGGGSQQTASDPFSSLFSLLGDTSSMQPQQAQQTQTLDLGDMLGLFGGGQSQQQASADPMMGLLGSLLGGGQTQQPVQQTQQSQTISMNDLMSLLGGQSQQPAQQTQQNQTVNINDLMTALNSIQNQQQNQTQSTAQSSHSQSQIQAQAQQNAAVNQSNFIPLGGSSSGNSYSSSTSSFDGSTLLNLLSAIVG